jgi:hypothetical protein
MEDGQNAISWLGHMLSSAAIVGTIVGWFPAVAAVVALFWYIIQIYESKTCQRWLTSRRLRKMARLKIVMARLEALELVQFPDNRVAAAEAQKVAVQVIENAATAAKNVLQDQKK